MLHKLLKRFLLFICSAALVTGCKVAAPPQLPSLPKAPASFLNRTDTTASIADMPWSQFFTDPNLVSLIDTALNRNFDLLTTIQRIEVARANVLITKGALFPTVNGVASAGVERYGKYTLNGVGNYDTNLSPNIDGRQRIPNPTPDYFLGLRSSWELDIWGKLRNRRKAAYTRLLATEKGRQLITTALVAEIARLYFELLALDNEVNVIRKNVGLQQRAYEIVQVQKLGGRATELAVQQFGAQLLNTRSLEFARRQEIVRVENQLNLLLGRYPQPIVRGQPIREQQLPATVSAGLPATMLLRRPDVQQAELELAASRADISAARAAFLPSLTLSPYMGFNAFKTSLLFQGPESIAYGIVGGLTAPLVNRAALKAEYVRSTANNVGAFYAYQKAIRTGYQEVVTNLQGIDNYRQVYQLKEQEVTSLNKAVSISNDLFVAGYATYLEVITAQRSVLEAELQLTNARREQFFLLIDLYRALGGGWGATR
ncbi:efflux transporter outer membrane subunit [Hymenobacter jejuensis]|uniref:Efflux transporter outer membrane subunit n=1 Tax=Hymenobacter jejuensis TaxID=2502781 RepID=A0A5B8A4V6_9BACT|nr:efflux transporter outer membrane subunit [Hymenobacter jejuensis]QDA61756.1 efflux transporter outer membrane subunit [Hymenobacter jejuensis]